MYGPKVEWLEKLDGDAFFEKVQAGAQAAVNVARRIAPANISGRRLREICDRYRIL